MKPKRVLMIVQSNYDYDARIIRYCVALKENGIDSDVICLKYPWQNAFDNVNGVDVYRISGSFNQDSIVSYIFNSVIFLFKSLIKTITLTGRYNYSFIHVHNMPDYLVFSALYPKIKRIPVILDIHDLTIELFKEKWSPKKFNQFKFALKLVEKLSFNFADHIITVTKECVEKLISRGTPQNKITLIMNSPDEKSFSYDETRFSNNDPERFKILYHGTLAKRFGVHYVFSALQKVKKEKPQIEFHIYGKINNEYTSELRELAKKLDISDRVFFNDIITYDEIDDVIKSHDLGIVPYESTEYMNLALPTKAGEYALTGLPFIMADLISVRTVFREESVKYINPAETELLAKSILNLFSDKEKRRQMAKNAYNDIQKISWDIVMKNRYIDLINNFHKLR
jgi:glycosyltransferase involved in cell wall biosynthesis